MYKKGFGGDRRGGGNFGSRSVSGGSRRPSGVRGRFSGNRRSTGVRIDPSKFINKVTVTEEVEKFIPEHSFADFQIDNRLKQNILAKGYANPMPIQDRAIPAILKG